MVVRTGFILYWNAYRAETGATVLIACGPRSREEAVRQGIHALMLADGRARLVYRVKVTVKLRSSS